MASNLIKVAVLAVLLGFAVAQQGTLSHLFTIFIDALI